MMTEIPEPKMDLEAATPLPLGEGLGERSKASKVGVRFLDPQTTRIFTGAHDLLHVQIETPDWKGERLYRGVFAAMAFPISCPERYIALR
jgi:hypothetical protein